MFWNYCKHHMFEQLLKVVTKFLSELFFQMQQKWHPSLMIIFLDEARGPQYVYARVFFSIFFCCSSIFHVSFFVSFFEKLLFPFFFLKKIEGLSCCASWILWPTTLNSYFSFKVTLTPLHLTSRLFTRSDKRWATCGPRLHAKDAICAGLACGRGLRVVSSSCVSARWFEDTTRVVMAVVVWVALCVYAGGVWVL